MNIKQVLELYDIADAKISPLEGYDSENYQIVTGAQKFVLKFYPLQPGIKDVLQAENQILTLLVNKYPNAFAHPIPNRAGELFTETDRDGAVVLCRLLRFVEGAFFAEVPHTEALLRSFGQFMARLNRELLDFRSVAVEAYRHEWDLQQYQMSLQHLPCITEPADRKLVEYFFQQHREIVAPQLEHLRKSVIHGDANDWNVLVTNGQVSGIIDFGDMSYGPLIHELAIALSYAMLDKDDPIAWALPVIRGYHEVLPLEEQEIELLYYLIATRLSVSVCQSAFAKRLKPDSTYITISERPAWDLLRKWLTYNPLYVADQFRQAAGFSSKLLDTTDADLARRRQHSSKALSITFAKPIKMVSAAFQYMYDALGNTYLDCYNNIPHVGHCHPKVVAAGQRQMAKLNTNTRYLSDVYNAYAENLLAKFPSSLNKIFFVNSGSAATDLALRLAFAHTKHQHVLVMEHGYHGNTRLGIDVSHYKYQGKGGPGKADYILEAPIPDIYRGAYRQNDGTAGKQYATDLIRKLQTKNVGIAAFLAETVVGCGGQVPLAQGYLQEMYPFIRAQGGVCIADEVQTGFGRLGKYFWAFEMQEVVPDMVIIGKPMGNGHPMAAVVTTDDIAASFETGMEFFSSFGGNPVSCAIGQAVLDVIEAEGLQAQTAEVGGYLKQLFRELAQQHDCIGDVRGEGLFLGVDLVEDKTNKTPATKLAALVKNSLRERHILIGTDGPFDNVLKIKPPLCFTKANAEELVRAVAEILNMNH